jgi:NitT/TauT family transport system ATP-binding protein
MAAGLAAQNLAVTFNAAMPAPVAAVGPLTFEIPPGEFVCLVGTSGCGKSTLLRVFAGLQKPTHGRALLDGRAITGPSPRVGVMFQQANLMPWRTVLDNIALPLELGGIPREERQQAARGLISMLELAEFERSYPGELSGGMAQRAALGRVMVQQPEVLLLDEPFGALDALTREKVSADLLRVWARQQQTALMVTHDIREAVFLADRVLVLSRRPGRVVADIRVDLPRPRPLDVSYSPEFGQIARQVRAAIDES